MLSLPQLSLNLTNNFLVSLVLLLDLISSLLYYYRPSYLSLTQSVLLPLLFIYPFTLSSKCHLSLCLLSLHLTFFSFNPLLFALSLFHSLLCLELFLMTLSGLCLNLLIDLLKSQVIISALLSRELMIYLLFL